MDRFFNSKRQSMTNYLDIFKGCRLCGAGRGYKMPIIQKINNDDDIIDVEAELKQKIKECVSIDVHPDDRMPPLICELCVDKVNDFYEFREMCRATNARVRASLGLPPQTLSQDVSEDCILGVSGPVFHSSKEPEHPSSVRRDKKDTKSIIKKPASEKRSTRAGATVTPPPLFAEKSSRRRASDSPVPLGERKKLRFSSPSVSVSPVVGEKRKHRGNETLADLKRAQPLLEPKGRRSKEVKDDGKKGNLLQKQKELLAHKSKETLTVQKAKETKDALKVKEVQKAKEVAQKAKEAAAALRAKEAQKAKEAREAQKAKEVAAAQKAKELAAKKKEAAHAFKCEVCNAGFTKQIAHRQHQVSLHSVGPTLEKMSCTPCGEWFTTVKDAEGHHRWHRTSGTYYHCKRCSTDFKVLLGFTKHFQLKQCIPEQVTPDVECPECKATFATQTWMQQHKCPGPPPPPDACKKCQETFTSRVTLRKHEKNCKGVIVPLNPNNPHLGELRSLSIPMDRCDDLITRIKTEPGLITEIKQEPLEHGYVECTDTQIKQEIKQEYPDYGSEYEDTGFGDYGSSYSTASEAEDDTAPREPHLVLNPFARKNNTQVESLSIISLRSIFSGKLFKKKSKSKRKRVPKTEVLQGAQDNTFESLLGNAEETELSGTQNTEEENSAPNDIEKSQADFNNGAEGGTENAVSEANLEANSTEMYEKDVEMATDDAKENKVVGEVKEKTIDEEGSDKTVELQEGEEKSDALDKQPTDGLDSDDVHRDEAMNNVSDHKKGDEESKNEAAVGSDETEKLDDDIAKVNDDIEKMDSEIERLSQNSDDEANSKTVENVSEDIATEKVERTDLGQSNEGSNEVTETDLRESNQESSKDAVEASDEMVSEDVSEKADIVESSQHVTSNETVNEEAKDSKNESVLETTDDHSTEVEPAQLQDQITDKEVSTKVSEVNEYSQSTKPNENIAGRLGLDPEVAAMLLEDESETTTEVSRLKDQIIDDDLDLEINSVLQGVLDPMVLKKREIKVQEVEEGSRNVDDVTTSSANYNEEEFVTDQKVNDDRTVSEQIDTVCEDESKNQMDTAEEEAKDSKSSDQEASGHKSDDVMDLISDSGDDCHIVDSPEKNKLLEDQLLYSDDIEDENVQQQKIDEDSEDQLLRDPQDSELSRDDVAMASNDSNTIEKMPVDSEDASKDSEMQNDIGDASSRDTEMRNYSDERTKDAEMQSFTDERTKDDAEMQNYSDEKTKDVEQNLDGSEMSNDASQSRDEEMRYDTETENHIDEDSRGTDRSKECREVNSADGPELGNEKSMDLDAVSDDDFV